MKAVYMNIDEIEVSSYMKNKIYDFATECADTNYNHYQKRENTKFETVVNMIYWGKLGEFAVYKYLKNEGYELKKPCLKILSSRQKSFDSDLYVKDEGSDYYVHVKTQPQKSFKFCGQPSWLLQYSGKGHGHQDKLFKHLHPNDMMALTVVNEDETVSLKGIFKTQDLWDYKLLELPKNPWLQKTKRALYFNNFPKDIEYWNL